MPAVPAICDNCGTVFATPYLIRGTSSVTFTNNKDGPCPNCGGMGSIPDGLYQFVGDSRRIFAAWPADRLQRVATTLQAAKAATDRDAVEQALSTEPDLAAILTKLSPLQDGPTFWAFIAVLLTVITLLLASQSDPDITVNQETVIQHVITQPAPTTPQISSQEETAKPPPPRTQRKRSKAKRTKRGR